MKFEIERKFLLKDDGWKAEVISSSKHCDGLLSSRNGNKVRVRTDAIRGWLTIKGPADGLSRPELEYEIPFAEAEYMLLNLCGANVCEKIRYFVLHDMHVWHVDIYEGILDGFVRAEIEITHPNENFAVPNWIAAEVTGDPSYGKWATLARYAAMRNTNNSNIANIIDTNTTNPLLAH